MLRNRALAVFDELIQDLRYSIRMLRRTPGAATAILATLGLAIGLNTAIFTLVNALLFTNLPYRDSARLVLLNRLSALQFAESAKSFNDWKRRSTLLEDAALYSVAEANLLGGNEPSHVHVAQITANFPAVMGAVPQLGRGFALGEDRPGHDSVALISSHLWRTQFTGDAGVCGRTLTLNGLTFTIVGVLPSGFDFPSNADVWTPSIHSFQRLAQSGAIYMQAIARVRRDTTLAQAAAQQRAFLKEQNPGSERDVVTFGGVTFQQPPIMQPLRTQLSGTLRRPILLAFGAVLLLLLIGCANVASLVMARAVSRRREFAIRQSLGSTSGRLFRQLFTEHAFIGILGGIAGLIFARLALNFLKILLPADWPHYARIGIGWRVLAFTSILSIATGILSGLAPSWRFARRRGSLGSLGSGERTDESMGPRRIHNLLVCVETAIAMVLLSGAGLLMRSFIQLEGVRPGFQPQQVLAVTVSYPEAREHMNRAALFYREVLSNMRTVPGFRSVGGVSYLPDRPGPLMMLPVQTLTGEASATNVGASPSSTSPNYFRTMAIPLLRGRDFDESDSNSSPLVAIVNETLARKLWPGGDAVGQKLTFGGVGPLTVVGVVGSVRFLGPASEPIAEIYRPYTQWTPDAFSFVIRTDGPPARYAASARALLRRIAPEQPITQIASMDDYIGRQLQKPRSLTAMISAFALLGFTLVALGIYGLVSYAAARRMHEFGIRLALGADLPDVLLRSMRGAMWPVVAGSVLGSIVSLGAGRLLASELYNVKPSDPALLSTLLALLLCTAILAGLLGSRRVLSIDPAQALRHE